MATAIPAPLKAADITRFAVRAAQIEKAKPAAAYWCYYYVLDKILSQGLHKTNDECQAYVLTLMDKVEEMKAQHSEDDAMSDEIAGKAYMEQFGLETFTRADNAVRANKASKQTADTFQAAYTFLDVLHVWPPVDSEITAKIKYAKFHAVRIAKAVKAGEDPNISNPTPEPNTSPEPTLDVNDPEVRAINGLGPSAADADVLGQKPPLNLVDQVPGSPPEAPVSLPPYPNENSLRSTQAMPQSNGAENYYHNPSRPEISPLPPSEGGGYFPVVPDAEDSSSLSLPGAPANIPGQGPGLNMLDTHSSMSRPTQADAPSPLSGPPSHHVQTPLPVSHRHLPTSAAPPAQAYMPEGGDISDEAMVGAQKHARFAISALNFEDVTTAIKELKAALADLGVR